MMKRLLATECESVLEALATEVHMEGGELHARLANGDSIALALRGSKRGVWLDKSDMSGGDMLELVHRALGAEDHRVAFDWGKKFFGIVSSREVPTLAARRREIRERQVEARREKLTVTERSRRAIARYLSGGSLAFTWAPQLASYFAGRGINLGELPGIPKTLRWARWQMHKESDREWPAMLAPIVDPLARCIVAVHCTYLHRADDDVWRKAPVEPVKKVSAPYRGAVIPLLRGASGKPLSLAPEGDVAMIAEGIENALAAALYMARPGGLERAPRVFAGVAAGNLPHIRIPPRFSEVILICDRNAEANQGVWTAYDRAERNWLEAGLAVTRRMPPHGYKDFTEATEDAIR